MISTSKTPRRGWKISTAVLTPILLTVGLAAPAHASSPYVSRDGCAISLRPPQRVGTTAYVDYVVVAACGPDRRMELRQAVVEDDTGLFDGNDVIVRRTMWLEFTHTAGTASKTIHYIVRLPDTEAGSEEMFHEGRFRVHSGPFAGSWTSTAQSRNTSLAN